MKKVLYLMAIDWFWIKQRPQIFAEMLSRDYDVTVVYLKEVFQKQALRRDGDELEKSIAVPAIPFRDKNIISAKIQKYFYWKTTRNISEYDIVWLSHPLLFQYIPREYKGQLIYDCLDNHAALCEDLKIRKVIIREEKRLLSRADHVFASSLGLVKKMNDLIGESKTVLLRNGFSAGKIKNPGCATKKERYRIGYFGTIAEWMDFSLLLESLERYSNIEYFFWGPVSHKQIPVHDRIFFMGVAEHGELWRKTENIDCLIMPFCVNDIIKDVDPVKLYEYISMGKTIISVYYKELDRFRTFVEFYYNVEDYLHLLHRLINTGFQVKYSREDQESFLYDNTWEVRYDKIYSCLKNA